LMRTDLTPIRSKETKRQARKWKDFSIKRSTKKARKSGEGDHSIGRTDSLQIKGRKSACLHYIKANPDKKRTHQMRRLIRPDEKKRKKTKLLGTSKRASKPVLRKHAQIRLAEGGDQSVAEPQAI